MKQIICIATVFLMLNCLHSVAQKIQLTPELEENVRLYNDKINELFTQTSQNHFHIVKEEKLPLRSGLDLVLNIPLYEGDWYHFCFVGDPGSDKIKATLFLEGYGDLVQDRIVVRREHEFWTEFSFMCPQSGLYELRLFQKCDIPRPLSYLMVFKKDNQLVSNAE